MIPVGRHLTRSLAPVVVLAVNLTVLAAEEVRVSLRLDLGIDRGQNLGSLFEMADDGGRVTMGAGFLGVYNTYYRADRHVLQLFVRSAARAPAHDTRIEPLPRPGDDSNVLPVRGCRSSLGEKPWPRLQGTRLGRGGRNLDRRHLPPPRRHASGQAMAGVLLRSRDPR